MTSPPFERARSAEAKRIRETAILEAAARLAAERGIREVTLTDIAAAVGMHKSAMLRYFETREEIFLRLSASGWAEWSEAVRERLGPLGDADSSDSEEQISEVAGILTETLVARPLFCDLLAQTPLNLERGVSFEAVRSFKIRAIAEAEAIGAALGKALPVTPEQGGDTVTTAVSMAGALWQMAAPGTELRSFYQSSPELAHAVVDVAPRLTGILTALLRGYLTESSRR
ncbi:TetR/AcrR family transcriptional regulator [Streptomyces sp. NPDC090499]|uniref:TetR/AcrR family transcriptional regulator n=1 Tax=Streptomyces sp. NPDC090499 TaxID=3365965 RepID=UPI00382A6611